MKNKNIIIFILFAIWLSTSPSFLCASDEKNVEKRVVKIVPLVMNPKGRYQLYYTTINDIPTNLTIFNTETGELWQNSSTSVFNINPDLWKRVSPNELKKN